MPIYTYRCENCGVQFERTQKFSDSPLKRCPECNMNALRKVYTPVGIVFKGSGFYATDHRSPSGTRSKTEHGHESESKSKEAESSTSGEKSDKDNISSSSETKKPVKSND